MKAFLGYGYNDRDRWIETQVFPILNAMGFNVVHGKELEGQQLEGAIKRLIDQSDVVVGFLTIRDGQSAADFTSHIWVKEELVYADARGKPIVPIQEEGVRVPEAILGNRQFIPLNQGDRLACVTRLVETLGHKNMRRLKLEPEEAALRRNIFQWRASPQFVVRYRTKDDKDVESDPHEGRLEIVDQGFYLNIAQVPKLGFVEVEGLLGAVTKFYSGWVSTDAVGVKIM